MTTCKWCGDEHGVDRLCERAILGGSRRSFFFMFGAGVAGVAAIASGLPIGDSIDNWITGVRRIGEVTIPVNFESPRTYVDVVVQMARSFGVDANTEHSFGVGSIVSFRTKAPIGMLEVGRPVKVDGIGLIAPAVGFADPFIGHVVSATLVVEDEKTKR